MSEQAKSAAILAVAGDYAVVQVPGRNFPSAGPVHRSSPPSGLWCATATVRSVETRMMGENSCPGNLWARQGP